MVDLILPCKVLEVPFVLANDSGADHASAFSEARPGVRLEWNRRVGRAFEKAVRRKPLARRTRALCKLNEVRERC